MNTYILHTNTVETEFVIETVRNGRGCLSGHPPCSDLKSAIDYTLERVSSWGPGAILVKKCNGYGVAATWTNVREVAVAS